MRIASLVVKTKDGIGHCANMLTVAVRNHPTEHGQQSVLCFICSGNMLVVPAEDVESVQFSPNGAQHCNQCDQSLWNVLGAGIAANPVYPKPE